MKRTITCMLLPMLLPRASPLAADDAAAEAVAKVGRGQGRAPAPKPSGGDKDDLGHVDPRQPGGAEVARHRAVEELGDRRRRSGLATLLDDSRQPVDRDVFMRELDYYEITVGVDRDAAEPCCRSLLRLIHRHLQEA